MAQDPVLVCRTPWQREPEWPEELWRRRGRGNRRSFRHATATFHLLPALETRWPVATDRCKEAKSQVPGPIPPSLPRLRGADPRSPRDPVVLSGRGRGASNAIQSCFCVRRPPRDPVTSASVTSSAAERAAAPPGGRRQRPGAPPSWGRSFAYYSQELAQHAAAPAVPGRKPRHLARYCAHAHSTGTQHFVFRDQPSNDRPP